MRKLIATILIGLFSSVSADGVSADMVSRAATHETISDIKIPIQSFSENIQVSKSGFFYVRFAAAENDMARMDSVLPGLGIGYRRLAGNGAADISISGIGHSEKKNGQIFWTVPRASYLHYFRPDQTQSFYMGGGLAWGGLISKKDHFVGIIPSFTSGYEFIRKSNVLGFTELSISQPALAVYKKGEFPAPIGELTVGIGF